MKSPSILEELLYPKSLTDFNTNILFTEPYASPHSGNGFKNLINWNLIHEICRTGHADIWLPRQGRLPSDPMLNRGTLKFEQALEHFNLGRTILVRHAERAHIRLEKIASDFEKLFQKPVDIQVYCTPPKEEGFDWHFDFEDVFVIQSHGMKEFRLRKNLLPRAELKSVDPTRDFHRLADKTELRCLLKEGDWLYIPAGYWHKANAVSTSFHLSVGVMFS